MISQIDNNGVDTVPSDQVAEAMDIHDQADEEDTQVIKTLAPVAGHAPLRNGIAMEDDLIDDECRAEATFQFKIENISKMKDQALSPACIVRNLPWKILAMVRTTPTQERGPIKTLGFFLQCNAQSESLSWSCNAIADLRMLRQTGDNREPFNRRIQHLFFSKENDWGFSNFITWSEMLDPSKGFIKDDSVVLEVYVTADAPHGVSWDSKKHTGYVGLKNQGATCYMNSLLQTLYFTNKLRKAVYQMPIENDNPTHSVAFALQRVFYELQTSEKPVGTKKLTKSFGWETLDAFMQHDVQELCRVLLDNIENKMKGTCVDKTIPRLFEGKMVSYIKCKNIEYVSQREETFYDIQLNIKGKKNVIESFDTYVEVELLDGDNKYDAGDHGLQEAEKGVKFVKFPPVLHLQLLRFQYDPMTDANVKINDRFEFPQILDLSKYLEEPEQTPAVYQLHAVLVHSGDNHGGHYVGYIDPIGDGKWCKFDDDVVSRCTTKESIDRNFGGNDDDISAKHNTNAYMLVYIRKSELESILEPIDAEDIPEKLMNKFEEERHAELLRRKERTEAHLYITVHALVESTFTHHHGHDLFDQEKNQDLIRQFRVKKTDTIEKLVHSIATELNYKSEALRLWPFQMRQNQTFRPTVMEFPTHEFSCKTVFDGAEQDNPWCVFVETLPETNAVAELPPFNRCSQVCLFIKRYDAKTETLSYRCHIYFNITITINEMVPILCEKAGFPAGTALLLYEEVKPNMIEPIELTDGTLEKEMDELMDGDILIVQDEADLHQNYKLPTPKDYSRELHYQVEVTFCDKNDPNDPGFPLLLSLKMSYLDMAKQVANYLEIDYEMLQFFRSVGYKEGPGTAIKCTFEGALKDLFSQQRTNAPKVPRKLHYQKLSMRITELENKKQFKCSLITSKMKEEKEIILHPDKNGTVQDLLSEAAKKAVTNPLGTNKLRLLEISGFKITNVLPNDEKLENISQLNKSLRIEEIPMDELNLSESELLVPAAHFYQETYSVFGSPFLIRVKDGEPFTELRERIRKKLDIPEKEYDKFRFAIMVMGRKNYIDKEEEYVVKISDFKPVSNSGPFAAKPWLGLDHINKAPKRGRYCYQEKPIKIHH